MKLLHTPVLLEAALAYLNPKPGKNYMDATADGGGHAVEILQRIQPDGRLLALEWDEELFQRLKNRLQEECSPFSKNYVLCRSSYTALAECVRSSQFGPVAGVLFDFGLSSFHLEASRRGFSFQKEEPLDMRYSREVGKTAAEILAESGREKLETMLKTFGQERFSRLIAREIVHARLYNPVRTTRDLVEIIRRAIPRSAKRSGLHFATRTFQALRIAVNHELENIPRGLEAAAEVLEIGGRIVTIAFHSLEDGAVKNFFREPPMRQCFVPLIPKPLRPSQEEIRLNPRARSARLRAFEKVL